MRLIDADVLLRNTVYNPLHAPYITKRDVEEAPTVNGWVNVKDRLPEETGEYLFVYDNYYVTYVTIGWFNAYKAEWRMGHNRIVPIEPENITHWMPLPEPPKEDEK